MLEWNHIQWNWKKNFKKMTFFGQHGVENFFSYFSLNVSTEVFKISHSKKISLEKNFYLKIAVSALDIVQNLRFLGSME